MADEIDRIRASHEGENKSVEGEIESADAIDPILPQMAEFEYRSRRRRNELFDPKFFGEPAWDMLLDLFINRARGQTVATTSLCIASGVPPTTALRWIGVMEEKGLVHRFFCERDQRLHYVELTEEGANCIAAHLRDRLRQLP